jgi:ABC-type Mn2+/Zn2+ transport system permease subunit
MTLNDYVDLVQLFAPSLATAAAMAIGGSQVGTFVLLRREGMLALAIPQVVAIGIALSLRWGLETHEDHTGVESWISLGPPFAAAAVAVMLLVWSKRHGASHWVLPSLFVAGISLSFLIIANSGAHVEDVQHFFTGTDVAVSAEMACLVVPVVLAIGLMTAVLWRRWLATTQIPAASELARQSPARWDVAFLCLLTTFLLFSTSALGSLMVLVMLFLPAATILPWARRIPGALMLAAIVSVLSLAAGFVLSNEMEWPFSQSVGGAGFAGLVVSYATRSTSTALRRKLGPRST